MLVQVLRGTGRAECQISAAWPQPVPARVDNINHFCVILGGGSSRGSLLCRCTEGRGLQHCPSTVASQVHGVWQGLVGAARRRLGHRGRRHRGPHLLGRGDLPCPPAVAVRAGRNPAGPGAAGTVAENGARGRKA